MRTRTGSGKLLIGAFTGAALLVGTAAVTNGADPSDNAVPQQFVFIDGQVLLPHRVSWTNGLSLTNMLGLAGGFTDFADREKIEVWSGSRTQVCSFATAVRTPSKNILLLPGDQVYVPRNALRDAVQDVTVRHVKSVRSDAAPTTLTFEITNHTAGTYAFFPVAVEVQNQNVWKQCFVFKNFSATKTLFLPPHNSVSYSCEAAGLPTSSPLRFRLRIQESIKVNPTTWNFGPPLRIVSEEFMEPTENEQGKENSQK
jgi:hypothetical protein